MGLPDWAVVIGWVLLYLAVAVGTVALILWLAAIGTPSPEQKAARAEADRAWWARELAELEASREEGLRVCGDGDLGWRQRLEERERRKAARGPGAVRAEEV